MHLALVRIEVSQEQDLLLELSAHTPVREGLVRIGRHFVARLLDPESLEMYRIILTLAPKFPVISSQFQIEGPQRLHEALASYLRNRVDAGEIDVSHAEHTAKMFLELVRSGMVTRALLDADFRPSSEEVHQTIDRAVDLFLYGIAK